MLHPDSVGENKGLNRKYEMMRLILFLIIFFYFPVFGEEIDQLELSDKVNKLANEHEIKEFLELAKSYSPENKYLIMTSLIYSSQREKINFSNPILMDFAIDTYMQSSEALKRPVVHFLYSLDTNLLSNTSMNKLSQLAQSNMLSKYDLELIVWSEIPEALSLIKRLESSDLQKYNSTEFKESILRSKARMGDKQSLQILIAQLDSNPDEFIRLSELDDKLYFVSNQPEVFEYLIALLESDRILDIHSDEDSIILSNHVAMYALYALLKIDKNFPIKNKIDISLTLDDLTQARIYYRTEEWRQKLVERNMAREALLKKRI